MNTPEPNPPPAPDNTATRTQRFEPLESRLSELARLLDQYLADLQAGKPPDRARLLADHPDLAPQLEQALAGLEFVHRASADVAPAPAQLGDFRILREVGRGGMGVVYEAEQISLKRRVALKVLRFGAVADEVAMQRFQREAETVARLHHTNIVPIFAVGCEQGVRYYAMEFIDGQDLASLLETTRQGAGKIIQEGTAKLERRGAAVQSGAPLPSANIASPAITPEAVANWGLQAAEALAHAHARGVIHRDVKPSNLILDAEGRIWLTDFGLARRAEDVTLSLTGALLGTPRYMSPEQARASKEPIDHRTDIYSLGATLYELATGRPIFEAATAHEVLSQILHTEPPAPRQLAPHLPRDFETILLKCLAKEPARRYLTAQALADDLRAFLEGRPIAARRPSVPERVVRWARQHRRTSTVAAFSAGIALVLAVGGYLFWQDRQQARLGRLNVSTDSPNLLAELVDAQGRALTPTFPVPPAEPVVVPAGAHQLRLSASGLLSETWPVEITPRREHNLFVQLNPRWLWPPGEVNTAEHPQTEIVTLGAHADLLVLAHASTDRATASNVRRLRRLDGATGKPVWPRDLVFDETTLPAGGSLDEWKALFRHSGLDSYLKDTEVNERVRDLDGDGVGDPVLLSRSTPSLLAVSGANGRVWWWARVRPVLDPAALPRNLAPNDLKLDGSEGGFVVGLPAVADVDADGVPDYVACFHLANDTYVASDRTRHRTGAQNALVAVSGKTGAVLWRQRIAENWSQYANSSSAAETYHPLCRPALARVNGRAVVVLVEKSSLLGFDARTGEPAWPPLALGFAPDRAPDIADLDGDGQDEALFLRFREAAEEARVKELAGSRRDFKEESSLSLVAVALPDGAVRWERAFSFAPQWQSQELKNHRRRFHTIADLDGDSRPEIILSGGWRSLRGGSRVGFDLVDGKSGSNRWHRLVWARDFFGSLWNVDQFVVGPDLDGDGHRELFAAWDGYDEAAEKHGLFVGALSGATGAMLWRTHQVGVGAASALAWWHAGADGWPLLLVSAKRTTGAQRITLAVGAAAGRLEHTLPDVAEPRVADFDGDGILDLFYTVSPQGAPRNLVVKGTAPDAWRRLGDWRAAADFDGDGFTDLVGIEEDVLTARSGKDGRLLWRAKKGWRDSPMQTPQPAGDFDGDGVPDVLATVNIWREVQPRSFTSKRLPAAFSGKDGRQLWTAEELDIFSGSLGVSGANWSFTYPLLDWADLDRDGRAEVFAIHSQSGRTPRLSAVSGRDGRVLWTTPITRGGFALQPAPAGKPLADFNGDRVLDAALWLPTQPAQSEFGPLQLNVVDGRTGQPLWPASAATVHHPDRLIWPEPAVADLDSDGVPEVLATRHGGFDSRHGYRSELLAVNGRDGQVRWTWTWLSGFSKMWPVVVLKSDPGGPPVVCVVVETNSVATLVALDAQGQERVRRRLNLHGSQFYFGRSAWQATDVDADGREELLFLDGGHLCAAGGDALEVRWRWALPHEATRLVDVPPASAGMPPTLTVWSGPDAYGLDGATGQTLWRARVGDAPPAGGSDLPELRRLSVPAPGLPRVQLVSSLRSANNLSSVVRQAWPVAARGHYVAPRAVPANYAPLPEIQVPGRRLPWAQDEAALVLSGLLTLLVAGVPALLVALAVRWRSWWLGLLPLGYATLSLWLPWRAAIPAIILLGYAVWLGVWAARGRRWPVTGAATAYAGLAAAIFVGSLMAPSRLIAPAGLWSLQAAIIGLPGLAFWALCGWAIKARRWKRLAWLFGASVFAALLAAALSLWSDWYIRAPDEKYSWRGAYLIWFVGVMVAGLAGVVILGGGQVVQWLRQRGRKSAPAVAV